VTFGKYDTSSFLCTVVRRRDAGRSSRTASRYSDRLTVFMRRSVPGVTSHKGARLNRHRYIPPILTRRHHLPHLDGSRGTPRSRRGARRARRARRRCDATKTDRMSSLLESIDIDRSRVFDDPLPRDSSIASDKCYIPCTSERVSYFDEYQIETDRRRSPPVSRSGAGEVLSSSVRPSVVASSVHATSSLLYVADRLVVATALVDRKCARRTSPAQR